ncbi:MAG: YCF48-related protein [Planctomycetota bacterium]
MGSPLRAQLPPTGFGLNKGFNPNGSSPQRLSNSTTPARIPASDSDALSRPKTLKEMLAQNARSDATLHAVATITQDHICAVGDSGTILLSTNAGRSWELVEVDSIANLYAVTFLDDSIGVAVGGQIGNYTGISRGTILKTSDGGKTWREIPVTLPTLRGLRESQGHLIAWGDYDTQRRSSVFRSVTQGNAWEAIPITLQGATSAGIAGQRFAYGTDRNGKATILDLQSSKEFELDLPFGRASKPTRDASVPNRKLYHTGKVWVCYGANGTLWTSQAGNHWSEVELGLSDRARGLCNWTQIGQQGEHLWLCGFPGSIMLSSSDGGLSWKTQRLEESLPLSDVTYLDSSRAWGVGPLGRILATRDGGESWHLQRGARQLGLLALVEPRQVPWNALASSVWEHRIQSMVYFLNSPHDSAKKISAAKGANYEPTKLQQLRENAQQIGIASLNGSIQIETDQLRALIACWRPSVVLSNQRVQTQTLALLAGGTQSGSDPNNQALNELGLQISKAQESLQKIILHKGSLDESLSSGYEIENTQVLSQLGLALWDILAALPPQQLFDSDSCNLATEWSRSRNRESNSKLIGAVVLSPSSLRTAPRKQLGNFQLVMGRVHRERSLAQLLQQKEDHSTWKKNLTFVTKQLPEQEIAPYLWRLYSRLGGKDAARKGNTTLSQLMELQPDSDAAVWSMLEILRNYGSAEQASLRKLLASSTGRERENSGTSANLTDGSSNKVGETPWNATPFGSIVNPASKPRVVTASTAQARPTLSIDPAQRWFQLLGQFSQKEPRILTRPEIGLLSYSRSLRKRGGLNAPDMSRLDALLADTSVAPWWWRAQQESLIQKNQLQAVSVLAEAIMTQDRPYLDGSPSETFWSKAQAVKLVPAVEQAEPLANTLVRWAYDHDYIYLAAVCAKRKGYPKVAKVLNRQHDAALNASDRLEIRLDLDRDYSTYMHLGVAENGQTLDRCLGQAEFNPKWHVAVQSKDEIWMVEVAIPKDQLVDHPLPGKIWGLQMERYRADKRIASLGTYEGENSQGGFLRFAPRQPQVVNSAP